MSTTPTFFIRLSRPPLGRSLLCLAACVGLSACGQPSTPSEDESSSEDAGADGVTQPNDGPDTRAAQGSVGGSDDEVASNDDEPTEEPDGGAPWVEDEDAGTEPDPATPEADAGLPLGTTFGGLTIDSTAAGHDIDLFGTAGHRFWLEVSDVQVGHMNATLGLHYDDMYTPGTTTYANHMLIQAAQTLSVANYGKVEIDIVGVSTMRPWTPTSIPSLRIDTDEFQVDVKIDGYEHIRLNNSVVGTIFREYLAHRIYREMGYPATRSGFAALGSSVWGEDVWVPMTLMEVYKQRFCEDNAELIGGGETCPNMWEFGGDVVYGVETIPGETCQLKECDNTRINALTQALVDTPKAAGFKQALDPYVSWPHLHQFQCLSWILWTGDDMIHNGNNTVAIEREDGKIVFAPYSLDISAGQEWYQDVMLTGASALPKGCQADPQCWADTLAACEIEVEKFDALNPELIVDETVALLESLDMMREGDEDRAAEIREWYVTRQANLPAELQHYREINPVTGN